MKYFNSADLEDYLNQNRPFRQELIEILRSAAIPLEPLPTGETPKVHLHSCLEAILFDVYGTLVISQSGDVGSAKTAGKETVFRSALEEIGISPLREDQVQAVHDAYYREIVESHRVSREKGVDSPEVDIVTIWHRVLKKTLMAEGFPIKPSLELLARLSVTYESRSNMSCPMPGAKKIIDDVAALGIPMGIVSNAQFYTPLLMEALFGREIEALGFFPNLLFWSYREGRSKPSPKLFESALERLSQRGFTEPGQILYVGNDVTNDIIPPKKLRMKTALFAGDLRSLRKGEKDPLYSYLKPDIILTELNQLTSLF